MPIPSPIEIAEAVSVLLLILSEVLGYVGHGGIVTVIAKQVQAFLSRPDAKEVLEARIVELENTVRNLRTWNEQKAVPEPQQPV